MAHEEYLYAGKYVHRFIESLDIYIHIRRSLHSPLELSPTPSPIYNSPTNAVPSQSEGTRDFECLRQQHLNTSLSHEFFKNQIHPGIVQYPSPSPPSPSDPFSPYL